MSDTLRRWKDATEDIRGDLYGKQDGYMGGYW